AASEARRPAPARTATRARSRRGRGGRAVGSGVDTTRTMASSSEDRKATGMRSAGRGFSRRAVGPAARCPSWVNQPQKPRRAASIRARLAGAYASRARLARARLTLSAVRSGRDRRASSSWKPAGAGASVVLPPGLPASSAMRQAQAVRSRRYAASVAGEIPRPIVWRSSSHSSASAHRSGPPPWLSLTSIRLILAVSGLGPVDLQDSRNAGAHYDGASVTRTDQVSGAYSSDRTAATNWSGSNGLVM